MGMRICFLGNASRKLPQSDLVDNPISFEGRSDSPLISLPLEQYHRESPCQDKAHVGQLILCEDAKRTEGNSTNDRRRSNILAELMSAVEQISWKHQMLGENDIEQTCAVCLNDEEK